MLRHAYVSFLIVAVVGGAGCAASPPELEPDVTRAPIELSDEPMVTAYPTARNTLEDLEAARELVVRERPGDGLTVEDLKGDLGRYQFVSTLEEWFDDHPDKPYKQVLLYRQRGNGYVYYVVLQASPQSAWTLESEDFSKELFEPVAP